jgi:hypothetical protein
MECPIPLPIVRYTKYKTTRIFFLFFFIFFYFFMNIRLQGLWTKTDKRRMLHIQAP